MRHTCAYREGTSERASGRDNESKRNRGDRAIDKTPNAARPRLILQAYTHPLVFSLSSPPLPTLSTTIPFLHPLPLLFCPRLPPPPFPPPSVLLLPFVSLPLIPYVRPPLRALRTLCEEAHAPSEQSIYYISLFFLFSVFLSLFHFTHFLVAPFLLSVSRDIVVFFLVYPFLSSYIDGTP